MTNGLDMVGVWQTGRVSGQSSTTLYHRKINGTSRFFDAIVFIDAILGSPFMFSLIERELRKGRTVTKPSIALIYSTSVRGLHRLHFPTWYPAFLCLNHPASSASLSGLFFLPNILSFLYSWNVYATTL